MAPRLENLIVAAAEVGAFYKTKFSLNIKLLDAIKKSIMQLEDDSVKSRRLVLDKFVSMLTLPGEFRDLYLMPIELDDGDQQQCRCGTHVPKRSLIFSGVFVQADLLSDTGFEIAL